MKTFTNIFDFGDERLNTRGNEFIQDMQKTNSVIIRKIAPDWNAEIAYGRFLSNEKVTIDSLKKVATYGVDESVTGRHVLIMEDSSELNYTLKKDKITGLGKVGRGKEDGFEIHPNLVIDAVDGGIHGISDIYTWKRKEEKTTSTERTYTPSSEKESGRWISTAQNSLKVCEKASMRTVIADREADFYELFYTLPNEEKNNHVIVRGSKDRKLYDKSERLFEYLDTLPVKGTYTLDLPRTDERSAHTAILDVRYEKIKFKKPAAYWDKNAPQYIEINVVDVRERKESVVNNETPIHWRLFTTHSVDSLIMARLIIDWYCLRWWIEQLFRILKNKGLQIEDVQVEEYARLVKLVILAMITSVRSIQLTKARDGNTIQKLEYVFTKQEVVLLTVLCKKYEGNTQKQKNPYPPDSLAYGSWVIGRLGGWKGYASQTPAGPITMLEGLKKFNHIMEGWMLGNQPKQG